MGKISHLLNDIRAGGRREVVQHDGNGLELGKMIEGAIRLCLHSIVKTHMACWIRRVCRIALSL